MVSLPDASVQDLLAKLCGEPLGSGIDRAVYEWPWEINGWRAVVKITTGEYDFQNVAEWHLWQSSTANLQRYLAPVLGISPGGRCLWMAYCEPCPADLRPEKLPKVLRDLHGGNIGWLNGNPVVMDYGRHVAAALASNMKLAMRRLDKGTT